MTKPATDAQLANLARLLQLASPALPVGAYSYSQGLESAVEAKLVCNSDTARCWIEDVLDLTVARMEAPIFVRLCDAWRPEDLSRAAQWNARFLASRESAELRAETLQMGYSLARLLPDLGCNGFPQWEEISYPAAFTYAVARWSIDTRDALIAYLWSWAENQVIAATKAVPLGQTDAQRILIGLGERVTAAAECALTISDDELCNFAPAFALLCARHETQYSRLFRS